MKNGVYVDIYGSNAVLSGSDLYDQVAQGRTFRELEAEAARLGASWGFAAMATDEQLLYFIGTKIGLIEVSNEPQR